MKFFDSIELGILETLLRFNEAEEILKTLSEFFKAVSHLSGDTIQLELRLSNVTEIQTQTQTQTQTRLRYIDMCRQGFPSYNLVVNIARYKCDIAESITDTLLISLQNPWLIYPIHLSLHVPVQSTARCDNKAELMSVLVSTMRNVKKQ